MLAIKSVQVAHRGHWGHQRQLECSLQGKWGDSTTEDRGQYRSGQDEREKVVEPSSSWI